MSDQDDFADTTPRQRRRGWSASTSTDLTDTEPSSRTHYQQQFDTQDEEEDDYPQSCAASPPTQDISFLTKRLANLQLMDSLCPVSNAACQQQQQQQASMDSAWAMQIQLLLTHLAEQTDIEQESRSRPLPPPPLPPSDLSTLSEEDIHKRNAMMEGTGLYKQVLTDWLLRLDLLAVATTSTPTSFSAGSLYKDHPGLKREVEKIKWQHNVPSKIKILQAV